MQNVKIVTDSGSNLLTLDEIPFASAPLTIITDTHQYIDDAQLKVDEMTSFLYSYKGRSSTACPGVGTWLTAFGDAANIIVLTITGTLSGSYNAACLAKRDYEEEYPDRHVFVVDTLSAGPEMELIVEKIAEYIKMDWSFEKICEEITEYAKTTGLLFMLESMKNLANNGRVSPLVAKTAGLIGIRAVGQASDIGELAVLDKCRGENKALVSIFSHMKQFGYHGGKVRIAHCDNEAAVLKLIELIQKEFPDANVQYRPTRGLCSFYAEQGGFLLGYEKGV